MKKTMRLTVLLMLAAVSTASQAGTQTENLNARQSNQARRIDSGINSGSLTSYETNRLERGQAHLQNMENNAKADDRVTPYEQARLEREANHQSALIARDKHNALHDYNHNGRTDPPALFKW